MSYQCLNCQFETNSYEELNDHENRPHEPPKAKRNPIAIRYDILDSWFLECLAKIAHYGAKTYGDFNWQNSRLSGEKGPINHIYKHLHAYRTDQPYDHQELGDGKEIHLAAIAFNAMMEFWYCTQGPRDQE